MDRSLTSYCPWGCKGSDTTEQLTQTHTYTHTKRKLKHLRQKKKKKWLSHLRLAGQKEVRVFRTWHLGKVFPKTQGSTH